MRQNGRKLRSLSTRQRYLIIILFPVFNFLLQFRAEVKNELGEGSRVGDVAKELGKRWKQMTDVSTYFLMLNRFGWLTLGQLSGGQEGVQRRGGSTKGRL